MKTLVKNYTFNKASKQITINNLETIDIEQVLLITNVTTNTIIYNFADPNLGGTVSLNIITLDYNTVAMSDTDSLQIFIDVPNYNDIESLANVLQDGLEVIASQLQSMKKAQGIPDAAGRLRVNLETGATISTINTVSNSSQQDGYYTRMFLFAQTNQAWSGLRNRISVS